MKVYTKIVFDINMEVIEEQSFEYNGPVALCGGSGGAGSAGGGWDADYAKIAWNVIGLGDAPSTPIIKESLATATPPISLLGILNVDLATNGPYLNESTYDPATEPLRQGTPSTPGGQPHPESPIQLMQDSVDEFRSDVNKTDQAEDWATVIDDAITKASESGTFPAMDITAAINSVLLAMQTIANTVADSSKLSAMVTAYKNRTKSRYVDGVSRFSGSLVDINAVNSSAFVIGLSLMEAERARDVNSFEEGLSSKLYSDTMSSLMTIEGRAETARRLTRDAFISQAASEMSAMIGRDLTSRAQLAQLQTEVSRMVTVLLKEREESNLAIDVKDATWPYELHMYAGRLLGSMMGGIPQSIPPLQQQSALAGPLAGILGGAAAGAALGPVGAGVGAILGGVAGFAGV